MPLTHEQLSAVENRGGPLLVSAAAGSGKTTVLTERLLRRVTDKQNPRNIDDFLLITFTRAAAGEMRERISARLASLIREAPHSAHLKRQAVRIYSAHISTLHSYCQSLLKQYAPLCGIHPDSRLIVDTELKTLYSSVLDTVLERLYAECGPESPFFSLTEALANVRGDKPLCELVLDVYEKLQAQPDPRGWLDRHVAGYFMEPGADASETVWGRVIMRYAKSQAGYAYDLLTEAAAEAELDEKFAKAYAPALRAAANDAAALRQALDRSWDSACALLETITKPKFSAAQKADADLKAKLTRARDWWTDTCEECRKYIEGPSALLAEEISRTRPVLEGLKLVIEAFGEALDYEKKRLKVITHSDSEHLAAALLLERGEDGRYIPSGIAREESRRFAEILVDEYQDISPMQELIIRALTAESNLFMVGDVRQSIYRFRLADPRYFLEKYSAYPDADTVTEENQPRRVLLTKNFRSHPEILHAVNHVFSRIMSAEAGELAYTETEYVYPGKEREEHMQSPAVELLLAEAPYGSGEEAGTHEAAAIARRLRGLIDEGFPVSDGAGGSRPVRAGDMAVLMRAPESRLAVYRAALEREGFSVRSDGGGNKTFWKSPEIQAALALFELIDNPMREVPLLAALRCPCYNLGGDALAKIRSGCPEGSFYDAALTAAANGEETCKRLFEDMDSLRDIAPELDAGRFTARLYAKTGLLIHYGRTRRGKARQQRLRTLMSLARGCETVADFLKVADRLRESDRGIGAETESSDSDAVSVLSVHKSKGLEYPVVAVCDLAKAFHRQSGFLQMHTEYGLGVMLHDWESFTKSDTLAHRALSLALDKENLAEEMRILYVAMTRAREKLILSCSASKIDEKLILTGRTAGAVPPAAVLRAKGLADWIYYGADTQGWAVIEERDIAIDSGDEAEAETDEPVVITDAGEVKALSGSLRWVYPYAAAAELPSKLTVTGLKGRFLDDEAHDGTPRSAPVLSERRPKTGALTAAECGSAQHLAMQYLRIERCADADGVRSELDRLLEKRLLTPEQADAVNVRAVTELINGPYGRRMLKAAPLNREFKFSLLWDIEELTGQPSLGEEALFQGVVDCFWEEDNGLVLLDFKTDHVLPGGEAERAENYRVQLDLYARALTRIIKKPVAEKAVYFFETGKTVVM